MRKIELTTLNDFPSNAWLVNRHERHRFYRILEKWLKENPRASVIQEALAEDLIRLHLYEQRLHDCRYFWDGTSTGILRTGPHESAMPQESIDRKQAEWQKWWPLIHSKKVELYKLSLANSIDLHLDGNVKSITEFFKAVDQVNGEKQKANSPAD